MTTIVIIGEGEYYIGDAGGKNGINHVKVGEFVTDAVSVDTRETDNH